jgi:hypothetical protein
MVATSLSLEELDLLESNIIDILNDEGLLPTLIRLNRNERLNEFLEMLGHPELLSGQGNCFSAPADGKIIILGESMVDDADIYSAFKEFGIGKHRVELHTRYNLGSFNIQTLKFSMNYALILLGPVPHSLEGKGNHSSIISTIEREAGYTRSIRLTANNELKITKTSIKNAISTALEKGWIVAE